MKDLFDYDVYDRKGEKVGSVENVWANESKEIGFIGISTGWLGLGKNHLLPADDFTIDEQARVIRVPYDEEMIKSSPSFDSVDDLGDEMESDVYTHFGLTPGQRGRYGEPDFSSRAAYDRDSDITEAESVEVPLAEERLQIEKRERQLGEVRLRKVVRTEVVNQPVELRREEVVVERVSGGGSNIPGREAFTEQVVAIPVSEEEAVVGKTVHSAGAVKARKVVETEQENVSETLRKEDVEIERDYSPDRER